MHVPLHAPEQQVPSSQTPELHCAAVVQPPPAATRGTQLPVALQ
jgi:hypothetical protein